MCGRYVQTKHARRRAYSLAGSPPASEARPETWNLTPTTLSLVLRATSDGDKSADWLTWSFRDGSPSSLKPINARVETAAKKPLFRDAWKNRRCIVPADGWYEWREEAGRKQPYYFHLRSGEPLFFAGLWSGDTFCILTTKANGLLAQIHDRRPLALVDAAASTWINDAPLGPEELLPKLISPDEIAFHSVSSRVSSPRNDSPELIVESKIEALVRPAQMALF